MPVAFTTSGGGSAAAVQADPDGALAFTGADEAALVELGAGLLGLGGLLQLMGRRRRNRS